MEDVKPYKSDTVVTMFGEVCCCKSTVVLCTCHCFCCTYRFKG